MGVIFALVVFFLGTRRINRSYGIPVAAAVVPTDAEGVERGKHIGESYGLCVECHGENMEGDIPEDDPVFGFLAPINLNSGLGGIGNTYTDIDYVRAIGHGVGIDRKPLIFMPSEYFNKFSDEDLGAISAYLKNLPAVKNEQKRTSLGPIGKAVILFEDGLLPAQVIDPNAVRQTSPDVGVTKEYGEYLTTVCTLCHGDLPSSDPVPGEGGDGPLALNLTVLGQPDWSEEVFINALRTGAAPFGQLDNEFMPWERFASLTDDELKALWLHVSTLGPGEFEK